VARTVKQWRKEVTTECEMAGLTDIRIEVMPGSTHQRVTARYGAHTITTTTSLSPSDVKSRLVFRTQIRRVIREITNRSPPHANQ
jgi:hypothetical protein